MVDSVTMSQSHGAELPDCTALIKAQFSTLDVAAERGTSDETEVTHLHACAQPADKVRSCGLRRHAICISVTINWWWEETYTPTILPRSRSPQSAMHSIIYVTWADRGVIY